MYPNYTKAFLDLKDVFVKNVIQADSFLKIFIETRPSEQICPYCVCKTKRVNDYRTQKIDDTSFQGKTVTLLLRKQRYLCSSCEKWFFGTLFFSSSLSPQDQEIGFLCYISPSTNIFNQAGFNPYWGSLSQRSVDFWITSTMHPQISCLRLFPLISLKAMPLPGNISVSSPNHKNTEFWIYYQTAPKAIWPIT